MLRTVILVALLLGLPALTPVAAAVDPCPTTSVFVNLNGRAYITLDGHLHSESNGVEGFQLNGGVCNGQPYEGDRRII